MVKDELIIPVGNENVIEVNGKKYRAMRYKFKRGDPHSGKLIYRTFDEKAYDERIDKVVKYMKTNLGKKLTVELVLKEALKKMEGKHFEAIEKKIKARKKPSVRKGCLSIDMGGNDFVQIV